MKSIRMLSGAPEKRESVLKILAKAKVAEQQLAEKKARLSEIDDQIKATARIAEKCAISLILIIFFNLLFL